MSNTADWDTIAPAALGWCLNEIDTLYDYLEQQDTKGFIVLKDGKIVLEKYFGTFTKDSLWYWASAGKTITAFLVGKAQEENYLSLTDTTSTHLGVGWTNSTATQEHKIKISHQLTMTTDTQTKLKTPTGMTGVWVAVDYDNVFFSRARSMARFGLLMQNNCIWNTDTLLRDTAYINQMTHTSQNLNKSYGYLWWLNGKSSYMLPTSQIVFQGSYAPAAPDDMFAGLGKNGQILSISRSLGLVVVRMGNKAESSEVPTQLCNSIWQKLNAVMCNSTDIEEINPQSTTIAVFPNPAETALNIVLPSDENTQIEIANSRGQTVIKAQNKSSVDISNLPDGLYFIKIRQGQHHFAQKFIKQ
ncbi:MAG: T9SS type A sorting domain-containing protein [Sphingobacteriales bacterium]|nr:T9SS type A sorting domain-containing protein [Sphingobacteriales bacterium]